MRVGVVPAVLEIRSRSGARNPPGLRPRSWRVADVLASPDPSGPCRNRSSNFSVKLWEELLPDAAHASEQEPESHREKGQDEYSQEHKGHQPNRPTAGPA